MGEPDADVIDRYDHAKLGLGGGTQGVSGTVTFKRGVVSVQVREGLPGFLGGGKLVEQFGGTVQLNTSRVLGTRAFITDGTETILISVFCRRRLVTNLKICGFDVAEFRTSPLTIGMNYGKSAPACM